MDTQRDFAPFRKLLDQLSATFDRPAAKDELVDAYWQALREVKLSEVERNVQRIIRTATAKTRWPKPGQLRDAPPDEVESLRTASMDAEYRAAEARNARNWQEMQGKDPELYELEIGIAQCARILARDHESTPQHADARAVDWQLRQRRLALWATRVAERSSP